MPIPDLHAMAALQRNFEALMLEKSGTPFNNFSHPFFVEDEVQYKVRAAVLANEHLQFQRWKKSDIGSGRILASLQAACAPSVSSNLLHHKHGKEKSSAKSLYRVRGAAKKGLEGELYEFFRGGPSAPSELVPRFNRLAEYLSDESLGCNWAFLSYLAFVYDPNRYFPIRPTIIDGLLERLGYDLRLSGRVNWEQYQGLQAVADDLREFASRFGRATAIEIQSYMWVLAYAPDARHDTADNNRTLDFDALLKQRMSAAMERERIGLAGERYVLELERAILAAANRRDLARKVKLVSAEDSSSGYDILSFSKNGLERHIEVKTTVRTREADDGFFLSETERKAASDSRWIVARVWRIDDVPEHAFLGNIVSAPRGEWGMSPNSWRVTPSRQALLSED